MRTIGSFVTVHGQYPGVIEKEHPPAHWVVSYMKGGIRFIERVAKATVTDRKKEDIT